MCDIFLCSGDGVGLSEFDKEILEGLGNFNHGAPVTGEMRTLSNPGVKTICELSDAREGCKKNFVSLKTSDKYISYENQATELSISCLDQRIPDFSDSGIFDSSGSDAALSDIYNTRRRHVNDCSTIIKPSGTNSC